jgi:hypothetical protein
MVILLVSETRSNISTSGGSVLTALLQAGVTPKHTISVLVRGEDRAKILADKGVEPILFQELDEIDVLERVASQHDSTHVIPNSKQSILIGTSCHPHCVWISYSFSNGVGLGPGSEKERDWKGSPLHPCWLF